MLLYHCIAEMFSSLTLRYHGKIQDHDEAYYMQFNLIVTGLDSVEARRWINATLVNMVDEENQDSLKPMIDGGTEGKMPTGLLIRPPWLKQLCLDVQDSRARHASSCPRSRRASNAP